MHAGVCAGCGRDGAAAVYGAWQCSSGATELNAPIAALPLQIYTYANSPYDEWHRLAWAGALVLIAMIMVSVTLVRVFARSRQCSGRELVGVGIQVENLNAWYGTTHTLQDINLHIPANHATALIGPSGCGKSTFVRCLNRMHETNPIARATGTVKMGDLDIYNDASPVEVRRRVGMVFQRPNPFPTMSIYDNVASGLKLNGFRNRRILDETVERSLKAAALWDEVKDDLKKKSGRACRAGSSRGCALRGRWRWTRRCC